MQSMSFAAAASAALAAAALFGISTPLAKWLLGSTPPVLLAGLLYLGSGLGLAVVRVVRDRGWHTPALSSRQWLVLALAIGCGGVAAPVALLVGLSHTTAATAALLLNLEAVLTAALAWLVFGETANRRIVLGMALIVAGAVLLAWQGPARGLDWSAGLIALACLGWALDNNFTRQVASADALFVAGIKGLVAGAVNTTLAWVLGARLPGAGPIGAALLVGLASYGLSLVLFVLALRGVGAARTGAYFSTAPFFGAAAAIVAFDARTSSGFWVAATLMAIGVWLHLTEPHARDPDRAVYQRRDPAH